MGCASIRREPQTLLRKQALASHPCDIDNTVSDGNSHSGFGGCLASPKNSEGQILNGKVRAHNVGGFYPALHFEIVGLVEDRFHSRRRDFKSSMGSVNEHDPNEPANPWRAAAFSCRPSRCWRQETPSKSKRNASADCSASN